MTTRRALFLFLVPWFLTVASVAARAGDKTLQSFGVRVEHGQPVRPYPNNVALGLFNPDPLLDIAYYTDGKIQVWQNLGNGTFGSEPVFEQRVNAVVEKMEWKKEKTWEENIPYQFSRSELHIVSENGTAEVVTHEQMSPTATSLRSPLKIQVTPPIDFREVWRSETQDQPTRFMSVGDIDNDGRMEVAYAFYKFSNDSAHFVVYECVRDDSFAVDWDTVMIRLFGPYAISDVDNDGHKEIVLTYHPGGGAFSSRVVLLECLGQRRYRFYDTNIAFDRPPFKVIEGDVDHDGRKELVLHTSNAQAPPGVYATLINAAEFSFKGSTTMSFASQYAAYDPYTFDMAIGQLDGTGTDEIIPSGGSFGFHQPVPLEYLWYNGSSWVARQIYTGLESGTTAEMFVNLDADSMKELFIGGVGPVGHGSCYALDYFRDTTWRVMWADSSLRNTPLSVNAGVLGRQFVIAGANTVDRGSLDTLYTDLNVYEPSGVKLGIWRRDTASVQNFHILDIDHDGTANLVAPILWYRPNHHLAIYEYLGTSSVSESPLLRPDKFELSQNYPNPFNPTTGFVITIPTQSVVRVTVYDVLGREVNRILDDTRSPGQHTLFWNGESGEGIPVCTGVYFVHMVAQTKYGATYMQIRKGLLLR